MPEIPPLIPGSTPVPHFIPQETNESFTQDESKKEPKKMNVSLWDFPKWFWNKLIETIRI